MEMLLATTFTICCFLLDEWGLMWNLLKPWHKLGFIVSWTENKTVKLNIFHIVTFAGGLYEGKESAYQAMDVDSQMIHVKGINVFLTLSSH